jgi:ribonuclease HII
MPDFAFEQSCQGSVCGIDEVGRGPLAGPVVAAAVVLDRRILPEALRRAIDDSKKLSPATREELADLLWNCAAIGVGAASVAEIDRINILQASLLAMRRAFLALPQRPSFALIDGNRLPDLPCAARALVGGDGKSLSIAAASIIAKVTRDRLMRALARRYPGYGWERNMGYPTEAHREALVALGVTPHHRRSFGPVHLILGFDSRKSA